MRRHPISFPHLCQPAVKQQTIVYRVSVFLNIQSAAGCIGMGKAGIDGGIQQHKSAGTVALPQKPADRFHHAVLHARNMRGCIRQLPKRDLLFCQIPFQFLGHFPGELETQNGGFLPIGVHIPFKDFHLQRKGLRRFFFGAAESAKQKQAGGKGEYQHPRQQQHRAK